MKSKSVFLFVVAVVLAVGIASCSKNEGPKGAFPVDSDTSYAIGMGFAQNWRTPIDLAYDYKAILDGFRDLKLGNETRITEEAAAELMQVLYSSVSAEIERRNKEEGDTFLAENAKKPGIITTESGLQYEVIAQGSGSHPTIEDRIKVHYEGSLLNGTVFDSSRTRGTPAVFSLSSLIEGWKEGLLLMAVGGHYKFYIPSNLGYGEGGSRNIPPYATLIFDVELLEIEE